MVLPNGSLTLAKESGYRAVRITNLKIPEGSPSHQSARLVATKMTEAGLRAEVANLVIGPGLDGPRDRSSSLLTGFVRDSEKGRPIATTDSDRAEACARLLCCCSSIAGVPFSECTFASFVLPRARG